MLLDRQLESLLVWAYGYVVSHRRRRVAMVELDQMRIFSFFLEVRTGGIYPDICFVRE